MATTQVTREKRTRRSNRHRTTAPDRDRGAAEYRGSTGEPISLERQPPAVEARPLTPLQQFHLLIGSSPQYWNPARQNERDLCADGLLYNHGVPLLSLRSSLKPGPHASRFRLTAVIADGIRRDLDGKTKAHVHELIERANDTVALAALSFDGDTGTIRLRSAGNFSSHLGPHPECIRAHFADAVHVITHDAVRTAISVAVGRSRLVVPLTAT